MEDLRATASVSTFLKNISSQNMCNPFKKNIAYKLLKPLKYLRFKFLNKIYVPPLELQI